jgi:hypothetical protein
MLVLILLIAMCTDAIVETTQTRFVSYEVVR